MVVDWYFYFTGNAFPSSTIIRAPILMSQTLVFFWTEQAQHILFAVDPLLTFFTLLQPEEDIAMVG
jgi:hypothetical protein